jgi:hypothetical protein
MASRSDPKIEAKPYVSIECGAPARVSAVVLHRHVGIPVALPGRTRLRFAGAADDHGPIVPERGVRRRQAAAVAGVGRRVVSRASAFVAMLMVLPLMACAPVRDADPVEVVSLSRQIDQSQPDHDFCSSLKLGRHDVATYFRLADEVDPIRFHDEAMIMPCSYRGSIRLAGHLYEWEIFAGGAGYLHDGAAVNRRYLCRGKCLDALPDLR